MLQNIDTLLSITVSVLSIIGFLVMIFRRGQKPGVQSVVATPSYTPPAKRSGGIKTFLLLLAIGAAGFAGWRHISSPDNRFPRADRSDFENRAYDSRTRPTFDRFPHRTNDYRR